MSLAPAQTARAPASRADAAPRPHLEEGLALIRLAMPIAMIAFINMGMSITDTAMVSMLFGTDALASVAVGSDLYSIVFYLCAGVLGGLAPFYTAAVTRADAHERVRLERIGWMTVILLAAISVPIVWLAPSWLAAFGIEARLLEGGQGYTRAMAVTMIPMLGVMLYRTLLTAAGKPKVFLKVTLAMLPLNAAGNYIFMTGGGVFPALGPTGAGLSSLVVAAASLGMLLAIARRAAPRSQTASGVEAGLDWRGMAAVLRVGIPIGIATVTEIGIFLAATLYAATLSAADVAAHTLTLRTAGVAYAIPAALLQAAMVRMARAESTGDRRASRVVVTSSLGVSVVAGTTIFLLLAASANTLAAGFFDDSSAGVAAAGIAVSLLILLGLIEFIAGPGCAAAGLLRGRKDTRAPMVYVLLGYWAVSAPLGIYLCEMREMGILGIWIGLAAGTFITAVLSLIRLFTAR